MYNTLIKIRKNLSELKTVQLCNNLVEKMLDKIKDDVRNGKVKYENYPFLLKQYEDELFSKYPLYLKYYTCNLLINQYTIGIEIQKEVSSFIKNNLKYC